MSFYEHGDRWLCDNCDWTGTYSELLTAPHPWHEGDAIHGCPECKYEDELYRACDACQNRRATNGHQTTAGNYTHLCDTHARPVAAEGNET